MAGRVQAGVGVRVGIACGGTGGHLYPGLAVAEVLQAAGADVLLLVSRKEVDQQAVRTRADLEVATLPAVGLANGNWAGFARGFWDSLRMARGLVRERGLGAVLGMGGFMSAAPLVAARLAGRVTVLHEANAIPGRANQWLAHGVSGAGVYFPEAACRLAHTEVEVVGMPVRQQFEPMDAAACRVALGLEADRPVVLVVGGSQGARGLNVAMGRCLPGLLGLEPGLQFLHLTGNEDFESVRGAYGPLGGRAVVRPFLTEMELALGAATVAVARAGASTLAELAAMRVPAIVVPFPAAVDDHQYYNARALARDGAVRVLRQDAATPERLGAAILEMVRNDGLRRAMGDAIGRWHTPDAAARMARLIWRRLGGKSRERTVSRLTDAGGGVRVGAKLKRA